MLAWYFAPKDNKLRYGDNRLIVIGKSHTIAETPKVCSVGLHGSVKLLDALPYAPGPILYRVNITRNLAKETNKFCGQQRKYLAGFDASDLLWEFARKQALINIEKIKPYTKHYDLIVAYLTTGNLELKSAAWSAADAAAAAAADAAAAAAARSAATAATRSAAVARSAAWSAADAAAAAAATAATRSAAVARSAADATADAAAAAWSSSATAANTMLTGMVLAHPSMRGIK